MALGAGGSGGCWGFLGQAPAWGWCCPRRGGRNGTAHTQQCRMQTELREGGNKRLGFPSSSSPAGAPQRRRRTAARSWGASSLSSQLRHPLPALTGVRVGEPSHDKPSQLLIVRSHSSLPGLETPLGTQQLNTCPGPCAACVGQTRVGAGRTLGDGDMQGDISNLAL